MSIVHSPILFHCHCTYMVYCFRAIQMEVCWASYKGSYIQIIQFICWRRISFFA